MPKRLTAESVIFGLLLALNAHAVPSKCLLGIIEAKQWNDVSLQQAECMHNHGDTKKGLEGLCTQDLKDFSPIYRTYRSYEAAYQETFVALQYRRSIS